MTLFNGVFTLLIWPTTQTHYAHNFELLRFQYEESLSRISSQIFKSFFKWLLACWLVYRVDEEGVMIGLQVLNMQDKLSECIHVKFLGK